MQETPADRLLPAVVERIKAGTDLRQLVAAAALANARTFGGQDYDGYHAIMALVPAYQMSRELPESQRALPVLKVLYRNTNHIQQMGGRQPRGPASRSSRPRCPPGQPGPEALREATRRQDMEGAERAFAAWRAGRSTRPTTTSSTSSRTTSTSTASSWPGGPGPCSTSPARSTPTPCSASRCGSAWTRRGTPSVQEPRRGGAAGAPAQAARPQRPGEPIARATASRTTPGSSR